MAVKPGRNELCHCGSGKKYKSCCQAKENSPMKSNWTLIAIGIAVLFGLIMAWSSLTGGDQPDCPPGTVWSESHQHCH